ncbi:hypothetical protein RUND412_011543 [Rhizina undulata]
MQYRIYAAKDHAQGAFHDLKSISISILTPEHRLRRPFKLLVTLYKYNGRIMFQEYAERIQFAEEAPADGSSKGAGRALKTSLRGVPNSETIGPHIPDPVPDYQNLCMGCHAVYLDPGIDLCRNCDMVGPHIPVRYDSTGNQRVGHRIDPRDTMARLPLYKQH